MRKTAYIVSACVIVLTLGLLGCESADNPVAPSGTALTITAVPSKIDLQGDPSSITIIGTKPDGNPVNPGTQITLTTSLGVIRAGTSDCTDDQVVTVVEANNRGQASAVLCGDGRTGEAMVSASLTSSSGGGGGGDGGGAGTSSVTVSVQIGETDDSRPTLIINANPTIVPVGGESLITLIARASDGTPVDAGQRIRLTADLGDIECQAPYVCPGDPSGSACTAVCTDSFGEAEATYVAGQRSGTGTVTALLGTSESVSASITVNAALDSLSLTADPQSIQRSSTGVDVTLTAVLLDSLGSPLNAVLVRFDSEVGSLSQTAVPTNAQGIATATLTVRDIDVQNIPQNGTFRVSASATSEGQTRTDERFITVLGSP